MVISCRTHNEEDAATRSFGRFAVPIVVMFGTEEMARSLDLLAVIQAGPGEVLLRT
jgi:hypothetical protein